MERIVVESFTMDHTKVQAPFVRRCGTVNTPKGDVITKFNLRFTQPNGDTMPTGAVHALEHLLAGYIREELNNVIDISPMGCRTGFYLLIQGKRSSQDCHALLQEVFTFVSTYRGEVPGASPKECGNYTDMDLEGAKKAAKQYKEQFLDQPKETQFTYPQHKR